MTSSTLDDTEFNVPTTSDYNTRDIENVNKQNLLLQLCYQLEDVCYAPGLFAMIIFATILDNNIFIILEDTEVGYKFMQLPCSWTEATRKNYKCRINIIGYDNCNILILATVSYDVMIINAISEHTNSVFSGCFSISDYIPNPFSSEILTKFTKMSDVKNLKLKIFTTILIPSRNCELSAAGFSNGSLMGLPEEILLKIMFFLGGLGTSRLSCVARRFYRISLNTNLWHHFLKNEFIMYYKSLIQDIDHDWYEHYKICFKENIFKSYRVFLKPVRNYSYEEVMP